MDRTRRVRADVRGLQALPEPQEPGSRQHSSRFCRCTGHAAAGAMDSYPKLLHSHRIHFPNNEASLVFPAAAFLRSPGARPPFYLPEGSTGQPHAIPVCSHRTFSYLCATMIPYTRKTLPNGLTVVVNRDRASKLAAVNILYRVGARNENPARCLLYTSPSPRD